MDNLGFWAMAAGMAALVAAILLLALRRAKDSADATGSTGVYQEQIAEVARDVARGTVSAEEADRLKTEIGRRLLDADRADHRQAATASASSGPGIAVILTAILASLALYAWWGAPGYPDVPLAERLAAADAAMAARPSQADAVARAPKPASPPAPDAEFAALMDKLRATVASRPDDATGLALLARNEAALGNLEAAETAQRQLVKQRGDASDHAGLAEILIRAAGGYISPEAEAELVATLTADPKNGAARYYSGLMFAQGGRYDRAFSLWRPLLEEGPADAPWIAPIREQMPEVAFRAGIRYELPEVKGPDAADIAAAEDMSPEDRQAMIEGMVGQLSERLATNGGPAEDWAKLIRALGVLKRTDQAASIYTEAKARFAGDGAALSFLSEAAVAAGLTP